MRYTKSMIQQLRVIIYLIILMEIISNSLKTLKLIYTTKLVIN